MADKEKRLLNNYLLELPENVRLFRLNAGMAWAGEIISNTGPTLKLKNPRPFHGAPTGFPDAAGWTTVEVTPDMVGQKIAVFTGVEVKATGRLSKEQKIFRDLIESAGGRFVVLRPD
ncbi:VRR-NUC domain-containing protein [candidate division KSB1 bacterium]|nr:VRR-NUC domain-containing protein [Phycisphaerae bacterium]NIQ92548.1 VRR-NUC domain-containing protein [Deltaproteobacteria bacterium]NIV97158.1 VRR-NUC domain-containing protein [candidate division KSB1 bacterium]